MLINLRLKFQNRIIHTQEFCNCCGDEDADDDDEFENLVLAKAAHNEDEDEDDKDNDNGEDKGEHISDEADDELFDE